MSYCMMGLMQVRPSQPTDRPFLIEMARLARPLDGHPLPAGDDPEGLAILPGQIDGVVIATDDAGQPIGGAWWHLHSPPLVRNAGGHAEPEVVMAVLEVARGRGVGAALIEALVQEASRRSVSKLALNVHLTNPAARLYMRTGFRVAGAGRGWFGVLTVTRTSVHAEPSVWRRGAAWPPRTKRHRRARSTPRGPSESHSSHSVMHSESTARTIGPDQTTTTRLAIERRIPCGGLTVGSIHSSRGRSIGAKRARSPQRRVPLRSYCDVSASMRVEPHEQVTADY
jgi:GNAT superfamily N-acetyltransferase